MTEEQEILEDLSRAAGYCDVSNIIYNQFTFNFEFSQQMPPEGDKRIKPVCLGRIVMSPNFAKVFSKLCIETVQNYEKQFGEIQIKNL